MKSFLIVSLIVLFVSACSKQSPPTVVVTPATPSSLTTDATTRFHHSVEFEQHGRTMDAIAVLKGLVRDFPELPEPYVNLSSILAGQGDFQEASSFIEQGLQLSVGNPVLFTHRSVLTTHFKKTPANSPFRVESLATIESRLNAWRLAWESRDTEMYLKYYTPLFQPAARQSQEQWEQARRQRLSNPSKIEILFTNVHTTLLSFSTARTTLTQSYRRSDGFQDVVKKEIRWLWMNNLWMIQKETILTDEPSFDVAPAAPTDTTGSPNSQPPSAQPRPS